jgi:hypothetical protein
MDTESSCADIDFPKMRRFPYEFCNQDQSSIFRSFLAGGNADRHLEVSTDYDKRGASRPPVYVDIAHRAAFLYSFAMLVIAKLMEFNPCSMNRVWKNFLTALLNESRLRTSNEPLTRASPLN